MTLRDFGMLSLGGTTLIVVGTFIGCIWDNGYKNGKNVTIREINNSLKEKDLRIGKEITTYELEEL